MVPIQTNCFKEEGSDHCVSGADRLSKMRDEIGLLDSAPYRGVARVVLAE